MSLYQSNQATLSLRERVAAPRWALPLTLTVFIFFYQPGFARWVHNAYDHAVHYAAKLPFTPRSAWR